MLLNDTISGQEICLACMSRVFWIRRTDLMRIWRPELQVPMIL